MPKSRKAPRPVAAELGESTRTKLVALRDDCRRHRRPPVALVQDEDNETGAARECRPELRGETEELEHEARAYLDRLGNILEHELMLLERIGMLAPEPSEWARSRLLAMHALLRDAAFRTIMETRSAFVGDAPDEIAVRLVESDPTVWRTRRRKVPDTVLAIAEVCDAILGATSGAIETPRRRKRSQEILSTEALMVLVRRQLNGETPSDREIAEELGVAPSTFSEQVAKTRRWKDARASTRRKPGPDAEYAGVAHRSELEKPNTKPNLGAAIPRRKARA